MSLPNRENEIAGSSLVVPNTGLLTPRESPATLITPSFDAYFRNHERKMWSINDIPFDQIDGSLITEDDVAAVRWAMLIESHNPVYTARLLDYYRPDHEAAADAIVWGYEEFKHYLVLRTYLQSPALAAFVDIADLDIELTETRTGEWGEKESHFTPLQVPVHRTIQEIATGRYHFGLAKRTKEPVIKIMSPIIGTDEIRHADREFDKSKVEMGKMPRTRALAQIDELLLGFKLPGFTFIPDYRKYRDPVRRATGIGSMDVVVILNKVSDLVGKTHILNLARSREFRDLVLEDYNLDPGDILRYFITR